ncbi:hypothetical protein [Paenibacillus endoradicis]|uniref:hypothetical protein n=1 Tax=Paenibacillus endoradicis TaxID=2972487 RepID=UPI002158AF06|nr:hypothetical protein [Paenibacillus endoradicis]MCR8660178.1 hypothetical protein [Paenibacillus endoradicis]
MKNETLAVKLVNSLIEPMQECRRAEARKPGKGPESKVFILDTLEKADQLLEGMKKIGQMYNEYDLRMNAVDYWRNIIKAKIDVIGSIGGKSLMMEVYDILDNHEDSKVYSYNNLFHRLADGLHGWND